MGALTLNQRQRPRLLERPELWDNGGQAPNETGTGAERPVRTDQLAGFAGAVVNVRWATTAVSVVLAATTVAPLDVPLMVATAVVIAYTAYRSIRPLTYTGSPWDQALLLAELALFTVAVGVTGFWQSPLVIASAAILVVAGFAGGFRLALRLGLSTTAGLTLVAASSTEWGPTRMAEAIQGSALLLLTAVVAAYGRRISGEAIRRNSANLDRISQLTDANDLLVHLNQLAQTLPASLDRTEVLESSLPGLRGLLDFDRAALLIRDETDQTWTVGRRQGLAVEGPIDTEMLPEPGQRAIAELRTTWQPDEGLDGSGLHPESVGGIYTPLSIRDRLIGLLVIESATRTYRLRDRQVLEGFTEPLALALDNALLFKRLRRISVDEERSRIARDLHDRIGQSLASLGFGIDRLIRREREGHPLAADLDGLREDVRAATGEVREALYDLRADVAEQKDFEHAVAEFAGRLAARGDLTVRIDSDAPNRLPLLQEREMWRIAQEALLNVERHAGAETVTVRWRCNRRRAVLEITDDGRGMDVGHSGRTDSYGVVGMRERASCIGASMEIISAPGEGTTVRCYLNLT